MLKLVRYPRLAQLMFLTTGIYSFIQDINGPEDL